MGRLTDKFYSHNAVYCAKHLLGKKIIRLTSNGERKVATIIETEAYCGERDLASHSSKGYTKRTKVMYDEGGKIYVYLIYGMYWLLNVVVSSKNDPHAVLIRSILTQNNVKIKGPGKVGKYLEIDKSLYGEDLIYGNKIWIEENIPFEKLCIQESERIGVAYAGEWAKKLWRFEIYVK